MARDDDFDADPQDRAETLDETNLTEDGEQIANFDTMADVYDATSAEDDGDIDGLEGEADDADFDDDEVEVLAEADDERDDEGLYMDRDQLPDSERNKRTDAVTAEPRSFEGDTSGNQASGADAESVPVEHDPHTEKQLDHGLKETFPASDPVSINPGAD